MHITGTFEVDPQPDPPFDTVDGVALARVTVAKRFTGPLTGRSTVHMLAVHTAVEGTGAYVAVERITGTVEGRSGSFVALHVGTMGPSGTSLTLTIAPGSGTGGLTGISGTMDIQIIDGQHHYRLEYTLGGG